MEGFTQFLETEESKDVEKMLGKLPESHRKLLHGFKFRYQSGNVLKGDDQHIGMIHRDLIKVAAPWRYSREFTTLHEIAHLVWEKLLTPALKKEWSAIVARTPKKQKGQDDEELFAMAYACKYASHKVETHNFPEWEAFISKKVPR